MSDPVVVALITGTTTMLPAMVAAIFSFLASRDARRAMITSQRTETNTNHMKDELVALTQKSAFAEGKKHAEDEAAKG